MNKPLSVQVQEISVLIGTEELVIERFSRGQVQLWKGENSLLTPPTSKNTFTAVTQVSAEPIHNMALAVWIYRQFGLEPLGPDGRYAVKELCEILVRAAK